jgi:hypothetical protein
MPYLAKNRPKKSVPLWEKTLQEQIRSGQAIPLISGKVIQDLFLGGQDQLVQDYAAYVKTVLVAQKLDALSPGEAPAGLSYTNYIRYLLADLEAGREGLPPLSGDDLLEMARFKRITDDQIETDAHLQRDYLDFVKSRFYDLARDQQVPDHLLKAVQANFDKLALSEFPDKLGFPNFEQTPDHPLLVLAGFPFSIYLTTSHHNFIELALRAAGKEPRTEFCRWHPGLEHYPLVFESESHLSPDRTYQPSDKEPLVYHLFGVDAHPESLVLTDDDSLRFLIAISRHQGRDTDPIPKAIRGALAYSALILLGYELNSWEFRILYWGLIQPKTVDPNMREQVGISIQVRHTPLEERFFEQYLDTMAHCKVFWGSIEEYTQQLLSYRR